MYMSESKRLGEMLQKFRDGTVRDDDFYGENESSDESDDDDEFLDLDDEYDDDDDDYIDDDDMNGGNGQEFMNEA